MDSVNFNPYSIILTLFTSKQKCLRVIVGSFVMKKLEAIIGSTSLKKDVRQLSPLIQTSSLESFHSVILTWAPKNTSYGYCGMYARYELYIYIMKLFQNNHKEGMLYYFCKTCLI